MGKSDWKQVIKQEQKYVCPVCGKKGTDSSMNIHHKRAKSKGGDNRRSNLVAWHRTCHDWYHEHYRNKTSDNFGNPI